jgi:hypothetical protein
MVQRVDAHLGLVLIDARGIGDLEHPERASLDTVPEARLRLDDRGIGRRDLVEHGNELVVRPVPSHRALTERRIEPGTETAGRRRVLLSGSLGVVARQVLDAHHRLETETRQSRELFVGRDDVRRALRTGDVRDIEAQMLEILRRVTVAREIDSHEMLDRRHGDGDALDEEQREGGEHGIPLEAKSRRRPPIVLARARRSVTGRSAAHDGKSSRCSGRGASR